MRFFKLLLILCSFNIFAVTEVEEIRVQSKESLTEPTLENNLSESVIGEEVINSVSADSIDDILNLEAGVTTNGGPRSSGEAPQIRGLDSQKLFIYLDGGKQSFQSAHSSMLPLNLNILKTVKIHKSNFSSFSGSSVGGGLFLETKDPEDYLENKTRGIESEYKHQRESALNSYNVTFFEDKNDFKYYTNVGHVKAHDFKLSDGEILKNSGYEDNSFFLKATKKDWKFSLDLFQREDTVPINPTLNPPSNLDELNGSHKILRYSSKIKKETDKRSMSFSLTKLEQRKTRNSDNEEELRELETITATFLENVEVLNKNARYGLEFVHDKLEGERDSEELASYPKGQSSIASIFTELKVIDKKKLEVLVGQRVDHYQLQTDKNYAGHELSYGSTKVGLEKRLDEKLSILAHYSEGVNMPRIQDVYVDGLHFPGDGFFFSDNYFIPNEDLKPEVSKNFEVGFKYKTQLFSDLDMLEFGVQFFENNIRNYIFQEIIFGSLIDGEPSTTQSINLSRVRLKGFEVKTEYLYEDTKLTATYSQVRGRNLEANNWVPDVPADQYTLGLASKYKDSLSYGADIIWAQEQPRINEDTLDRTDATDSYVISSIYALKKFQNGLNMKVRVENLTDQEYRRHGSHIKEKGQDLKLSFKYKYFF